MSMIESKSLLCIGFEIFVGPFHQILDLCALQLLFMVDATRRHAGHKLLPAPQPQPLSLTFCRRKFRHWQWHPSDESAPKYCSTVLLGST